MQSVQRRFGKFLPRTADESQVAVLLNDFEEADKMLAKVHTTVSDHVRELLMTSNPSSLTHRKHGEIPGGIF